MRRARSSPVPDREPSSLATRRSPAMGCPLRPTCSPACGVMAPALTFPRGPDTAGRDRRSPSRRCRSIRAPSVSSRARPRFAGRSAISRPPEGSARALPPLSVTPAWSSWKLLLAGGYDTLRPLGDSPGWGMRVSDSRRSSRGSGQCPWSPAGRKSLATGFGQEERDRRGFRSRGTGYRFDLGTDRVTVRADPATHRSPTGTLQGPP